MDNEDEDEETIESSALERAVKALGRKYRKVCFDYECKLKKNRMDLDITINAFTEHMNGHTLNTLLADACSAVKRRLGEEYALYSDGYEICAVSDDRFVIHFYMRADRVYRERDPDPVWDYYAGEEQKLEAFEPVDEY